MSPETDTPLFSFGVITDTHIRAPEGDLSSPYPVNEKANSRARYASRLLAAQRPAFIVHLGDMVHPLPSMPSYDAASAEAKRIFAPMAAHLHYVSGNHDVGDKPMLGSPAAIINDQAMSKYSEWYGEHWYSFDHDNIRIVVINSSLINSGIDAEQAQSDWLQATLENSKGYRVILFSHYPPFLHDRYEDEHYDNIAQPGRDALLNLIENSPVKLVLSGHVHHFFYSRLKSTDFYTLPSTSFTRQDYSDMFKTGPAPEFGRDDKQKFVVTMVDVYEDRFGLRLIDTDGREQIEGDCVQELEKSLRPAVKPLTVSLRHAWHESIELPFNGPMEEFTRKRIRNDYALLRLLQMGIYQLRVPLQDLAADSSRKRIQDFSALGFRFHVMCLQQAWQAAPIALKEVEHAIASIEYILPNDASHWKLPLNTNDGMDTPLCISYASSGAVAIDKSKPFAHTVSSGFDIDNIANAIEWVQHQKKDVQIASVVVQIPWEAPLEVTLEKLNGMFTTLPYKCVVNLRLACSNPAGENKDEKLISKRLLTALKAVESSPELELQLDTFMTLDRGYSPRHGLIDRLCNLTTAGRALIN